MYFYSTDWRKAESHRTNFIKIYLEELYQYLNSVSPIREETWIRVRELFSETTLHKGAYFIREGENARQIAFLTSGIIRAFYRSKNGKEYNKHFFLPNNLAGAYSALVTSTINKINQQALADCTLWVANYSEIVKLYDSCPDFERVGRRLAERYFSDKEQREVEIVLLDADERYLNLRKMFPELEKLVPQYHIASYLGITPTQLSRIRRKFTQQ